MVKSTIFVPFLDSNNILMQTGFKIEIFVLNALLVFVHYYDMLLLAEDTFHQSNILTKIKHILP